MIEREKKYLVSDVTKIKDSASEITGIAQWYTVIKKGYEERIRLVVHTNGITNVYKTTKEDTSNADSRIENEIELSEIPDDIDFRNLPAVLKIRYILPTPAKSKEAILDRYLAGPLINKYVLEIESADGNIDEIVKEISDNVEDVTNKSEYKNKNLATSIGLTPQEAEKVLVRKMMGYDW